jgi:chromosome partitioning protein
MTKIISIVNQKGGVGKTTTAINLGSYLAKHGKFVLLVDIDPQANATSGLGVNHRGLEKGIYETLIGPYSVNDIILETGQAGYRLAPATISLAGAAVELVNIEQREHRLSQSLLPIKGLYDYVLIDCPPSLGLLTVNALTASDQVLIPVQAEYYALEGLSSLLRTINLVQENLQSDLNILGAVITMYDPRYKLSNDIMNELYKFFPNKIFRSVIPRNIRLSEAPSHGRSILDYDAWSKGAKAYERLAREILDLGS